MAGEVPFLFAGAVLGVARARDFFTRHGRRTRRFPVPVARVSVGTLATFVLAAAVLGNFLLGPLPFSLPGGHFSGKSYAVSGHAKVLDMAVKLIPRTATVSTENNAGSHLSARRVVYTFPYIGNAQWVIVDQKNQYVYDRFDPVGHSQALGALVLDQNYQSVFARDGVYVFKRVGGAPSTGAGSAPSTTPSPSASASATPSATSGHAVGDSGACGGWPR